MCQQVFLMMDAIKLSQTHSAYYMESLIANNQMDKLSLSSYKVDFLLSPLLPYKQKLQIMAKRSSS